MEGTTGITQNELPFFFPERRTSVMLEPIFLPLILILAAVIIGFCLILPGIRGRERIFAALRFFLLGTAGSWMLTSFFCTEWISATAKSTVQFYNHEQEFIESDIKLQLGFFSANITVRAVDEVRFPNRNWNERFQMSTIDTDYNFLLQNNVPVPILQIVSHFTSRSSRISLQRSKKFILFFRISFAFQILAMLLWLVSICIISKTIVVGAQFLLFSGLGQLMACTMLAFVPEMIIHLPGSQLETGFGWCWSLNIGMGLYSLAISIAVQLLDYFAQPFIQEFFNFAPWEEDDCFDCKQLGHKCDYCNKVPTVSSMRGSRYESETVRAVRQMVNGGKLYPKAISLKLENELKYEKKLSSGGSSTESVRPHTQDSAIETASTISSKVNDTTLEFGDWTIMEPGNFGTECHFVNGFVSPKLLPTLQNGVQPSMSRQTSNVSTTSEEA